MKPRDLTIHRDGYSVAFSHDSSFAFWYYPDDTKGGKLYIEDNTLIDYEGSPDIPSEVFNCLIRSRIKVSEDIKNVFR